MPEKIIRLKNVEGLSAEEVIARRSQYGKNIFQADRSHHWLRVIIGIVKEPMFVLLVIACSIYFILGEVSEGFMMLIAIVIVTAISMYQEVKSGNALKALRQFSEPKVVVIRDNQEIVINTEELVPGDVVLLNEGMNIPADAIVLEANDFTVNEAIITGESLPAGKQVSEGTNALYQGSTINSGRCIARVTATGNNTVLGKLGTSIASYQPPTTFLQTQINRFVRRLAIFGLMGFMVIFYVNYLYYHNWVASLLFALTLAMSALPEEIPVAFSSFMALGAYKMSKLGIISRQPQVIENLGAVSVMCLDKTGTITENKMQVKTIYDHKQDLLIDLHENGVAFNEHVLFYAVLASERNPFDSMEKAIWEAYHTFASKKETEKYNMLFEYPLQGQPPMMTHVYTLDNVHKVVAAKGAAERIIRVCRLSGKDIEKISRYTNSLASKGYRVIAIASALFEEELLPSLQDDFNWQFEGLLALYDPPKKNVAQVLKRFYQAHIQVKLITGDHPETAINIAEQVGIVNQGICITGEQVMKMKDVELAKSVKNTNIFARMFPDAKLKVIEAIKASGEIVGMSGDGVNDGPALRSADIGIAMGERGTEIARQAADLILTDDNMERMAMAIQEGRKIFSNLKKAVRYIISIHIPIILTASLPVIFRWKYPNIFTPIHVIFMELIMGPTCSIFFEKEPVEEKIMLQRPRLKNSKIFSNKELLTSIIQGIIIASGLLTLYYYFMTHSAGLKTTRTIVFTTLVLSNLFLTFACRSFSKNLYYTSRYSNPLVAVIIVLSVIFLFTLHVVPFVQNLFQLTNITLENFWACLVVALVSVMWFEIYKTVVYRAKEAQPD